MDDEACTKTVALPSVTTRKLLSCEFFLLSFVDRKHLSHALSGRSENIFSDPNKAGRLFRWDFHGYEARDYECNHITTSVWHVVKTFCVLWILSLNSGFEVSGRLSNASWTSMGSESMATDYLRLLHVHYNQRFFICMKTYQQKLQWWKLWRVRLHTSCSHEHWNQDLYL